MTGNEWPPKVSQRPPPNPQSTILQGRPSSAEGWRKEAPPDICITFLPSSVRDCTVLCYPGRNAEQASTRLSSAGLLLSQLPGQAVTCPEPSMCNACLLTRAKFKATLHLQISDSPYVCASLGTPLK
ncbi:hypothetical protein AAFF_G00084000 [Aldrovandia affinis]|uniref:Uncharacterized protein n=1 Tax=Aldrovandia affinis TaxID=143900 RepID=A0AAD7RWZ8_9TELE|nr:hypothetical protein AAFF_G00084000 [Aldrovandia affinis]